MNLRPNALFVVKMLPREEELVLDSTGTSLYSFNACALVKAKKLQIYEVIYWPSILPSSTKLFNSEASQLF